MRIIYYKEIYTEYEKDEIEECIWYTYEVKATENHKCVVLLLLPLPTFNIIMLYFAARSGASRQAHVGMKWERIKVSL